MPKRKVTFRVDTTEVQGEDSWVEMSHITCAEAQAYFKTADIVPAATAILVKHVVAWNWVDSDGEPFGDPQDHMVDLFRHERELLIGKLFKPESEEDLKN